MHAPTRRFITVVLSCAALAACPADTVESFDVTSETVDAAPDSVSDAGADVAVDADITVDGAPPDGVDDVQPAEVSPEVDGDSSADGVVSDVPDTADDAETSDATDASETVDAQADAEVVSGGDSATSCGSPSQGLTPVDCTENGDTGAACVFSNHCLCSEGFVCDKPALSGQECQAGSTCEPLPDFPPHVFPAFTVPDVTDASSFGSAYLDAVCHALLNCRIWSDNHIQAQVVYFPTIEACRDFNSPFLLADGQDLGAAVAAGTISYDSVEAASCLQTVANSCLWAVNPGKPPGTNCGDAFVGQVALGDACLRSEECSGDAYCDHGVDGASCPGVCVPALAPGDSCTEDAQCGQGGSLQWARCTGQDQCWRYTMAAQPAGYGEPCGRLDDTPFDVATTNCAPEYACNTLIGTGVCVPPYPAGEPCFDGDAVCVPGYICDNVTPGEPKTCLEAVTSFSPGEPCGGNIKDPPYCDATLDLLCDFESEQCVAGGDGTLGAPCGASFTSYSTQLCHNGLVCDPTAMACIAPQAAGTACTTHSVCVSGQCDETTGTCRQRRCQ